MSGGRSVRNGVLGASASTLPRAVLFDEFFPCHFDGVPEAGKEGSCGGSHAIGVAAGEGCP